MTSIAAHHAAATARSAAQRSSNGILATLVSRTEAAVRPVHRAPRAGSRARRSLVDQFLVDQQRMTIPRGF